MTASALAVVEREAPDVLTQYEVTAAQIAAIKAECADLSAETVDGYEAIRVMLGKARTARTTIEKRRKSLKAEHIERGRKIDAAAHALTELVVEFEGPLQAKKDAVDDARAKAKQDAERAELLALEAKLKADREAEEAKAKAEREAEEKRIADERARHAAERAEFEKRQAEADAKRKAEEEALAQQRADLEAREREVREAGDRNRRAEEDRLAAALAQVAADEAERANVAELERLAALRPDIEKVRAWAPAILALTECAPEVTAPEAKSAISWAVARLLKTAEAIENFMPTGQ